MKKLINLMMLLVAIVTGAKASTVDDLTAITEPCTFTMYGINGTSALVDKTLYSSSRLLCLGGCNYDGTNKGTTTYKDETYKNVYQIKSNRQIALKIAFNAVITIVGNSHSQRSWRIGTSSGGYQIADGGNGSTTATGAVNGSVVSPVTVYINASNELFIGAIIITAPAIPSAVTFSPATGSSVNAGSSITLSAEDAASYKYKWTNSTDTPTDGWSTGNKATVPAFGSENIYLHACGVSAAGEGTASYAQYTITQPVVATPTFSPSSSSFTSASIDVTIACATTDYDAIMYSFDNSTWTEYTGAITINTSKRIYAKATKSGYIDSDVASKKYVKQDAGTSGSASSLVAVSTGYTFIAESIVPGAEKLYLDNKIYTTKANTVKADKGSSTIAGESYPNCMRLRKGEDVVFKTDGPCLLTLYCSSNNTNAVCVGSEAGGDQYGSYTTATTGGTREFIIPAAGTVYVTGSGDNADWCIAGFTLTELRSSSFNLNAKGFATYSSAYDFTFSGAKAYKMALDETAKTITGTEVTDKIAAGEGILLKGEAGATVTITETLGATALTDNSLKGSTKADGTTAVKPTYCYVLSGDTFMNYSGTDLTANKAYIQAGSNLANSLDIVFEGGPTAVEAIAEAKASVAAPVKIIKNGKLFIGNYNVAGARIK